MTQFTESWPELTVIISHICYRATVIMILKELDPEGVAARKAKYLKRRVYHNKVNILKNCMWGE